MPIHDCPDCGCEPPGEEARNDAKNGIAIAWASFVWALGFGMLGLFKLSYRVPGPLTAAVLVGSLMVGIAIGLYVANRPVSL